MTDPTGDRRRFLAAVGAAGAAGLAGCSGFGGLDGSDAGTDAAANASGSTAGFTEFRGSGPLAEGRGEFGGTRIADLPDLSGELTVYLGGGEGGLYRDLVSILQEIYPDFRVNLRESGTADAANTIIGEGEATPADVFWSVDAGSLAAVANEGLTATLPAAVVDPVPQTFHPDDEWVGVAGRARSIPYNTDALSAEGVPESVMTIPDRPDLAGSMGWAPTYGAFQAFVTAMRILEGEGTTREWLSAMVEAGVTEYSNEFLVSNAVADGEIDAGFANHYYALRVQASRPDAPVDLAFTSGDAGGLINAAGAAVLAPTDAQQLANTFVRHLLSAEAQEFFATRTYAYPMVEGIPPVGGLPSIDELNPPDIDLGRLSNLQPTLELMREVGVL
ncbi:extracellular solute-binding protein [Candidatus Halobonum tyrrellensis]|uniref:Family 1 extracellular solute-binding protein n=1 Tax=Candidatus Halobonum tyrrellensis G22 TaxID=1324957 RepID=V4GXE2_9EURY|nr:extracellular solute-binding protein [Candidatus Halobonum tyrrellensis]ESP89806.1 family 1 extracellular solute-binding protein [Candidatus Halobonum tyrrellensis G22]